MKIPDKIKIGGITYKIVYEKLESCCGKFDKLSDSIIIDTELTPKQKEVTFLHEVIHAINIEIGEPLTESLAHCIHQVLTDNKL